MRYALSKRKIQNDTPSEAFTISSPPSAERSYNRETIKRTIAVAY